ncbi:MAG: ChaN family lipoprotein, partial [Thermodesulfobacteriota bacterium]
HPGRQALGMEMFSRSQQPALDRWVAGELSEKQFLRESRWSENWGGDFAHYRDLLNTARARRIPVIALNADRDLVATLRGKTPDQLGEGERARLPVLDMDDPYHRGMVTAVFGGHSHTGMQREDFMRVQTLWDETMAESVVRYLQSPSGRDMHLLVVAGGNHVSYGFGIPRRVFKRLPVSYLLIGGQELHIPADKQDRLMNVSLPDFPMVPYDFVAYLAYEDLPKTGVRLGVVITPAPAGQGLLIRHLTPGSSAEKAGLQAGDLLLALDGEALADASDLIHALERRQPGSRGTLRVSREGKTLTIDVLFTSVP